MSNVPDDYHTYWHRCPDCGKMTHPAEQPCACVPCDRCGVLVPPPYKDDVGAVEFLCRRCADLVLTGHDDDSDEPDESVQLSEEVTP
jgi:hypothetical protein